MQISNRISILELHSIRNRKPRNGRIGSWREVRSIQSYRSGQTRPRAEPYYVPAPSQRIGARRIVSFVINLPTKLKKGPTGEETRWELYPSICSSARPYLSPLDEYSFEIKKASGASVAPHQLDDLRAGHKMVSRGRNKVAHELTWNECLCFLHQLTTLSILILSRSCFQLRFHFGYDLEPTVDFELGSIFYSDSACSPCFIANDPSESTAHGPGAAAANAPHSAPPLALR
ncbi:hypothetical protein EVAR_97118_1 [Eumeta japonica]|uniref:Uncharacterized protein n=1 Tax=Eumeta variegata TaxID=151549 RepID=A0A4C1WSM3_EUMVA|nr:hypothetical protein EVAR_97118_1 [Eumeta japonica]